MVLEQQLRVPGPTPIPERVVRSASRPMINHRGPEFAALLRECEDGMRWALQTGNAVLFFPASGTGGLEAAAVNLLSPGERALFCTIGSFGERWASIAEAYGVDVVRLAMPWGEPIDPEDVDRVLAENPDVRSVFVTHNETSTGVTNDIPAIASVVKGRGLLLAVDSVSGAASIPFPVDALGVDVAVTGSQKGWLSPPGIAMISVSEAALARQAEARCPRWYFDFERERKAQEKGQTSTTPPLSVLYAVREGLAILREEGLDAVFARHHRVASMIRAGVEAIGLELLAAAPVRSDTVTAIKSPLASADDLKAFIAALRTQYGLVLAGGQGQLQGKVFRIGHLGMVDERDAYAILATIEQAMVDHGLLSRAGLSVAAAQATLRTADESGSRRHATPASV